MGAPEVAAFGKRVGERAPPGAPRSATVRNKERWPGPRTFPFALGQKQIELVAEPLAPVAQVRALVRECTLEKLLPGEVLEIWVVDPALADLFVGQRGKLPRNPQKPANPNTSPRPLSKRTQPFLSFSRATI